MDRLSAPVMRMATAMRSLVSEMEAADRKNIDPKGLSLMKDSISKANMEMRGLQSTMAQSSGVTNQNISAQNDWNRAISNGKSNMNGLVGKLKAAIGLYALLNGAKNLIRLSDEAMTIDAKLNLITDNAGQKNNLKMAMYQMAQDARVPLNAFANDVAKLGILAGKRFAGNGEIVQFMGNAAKAFKIAGASASETTGAMTQLNQALASGVLQGDEFRSIRENAPLITQAIAKEMGVSQDHLKQLASEGQITADVVRRAVLGMTNDLNKDFGKLPMTWRDVWTQASNFAIRKLDGVLRIINRLANSEKFRAMATSIAGSFEIAAGIMTRAFERAIEVAGWVYEKWDMLKIPIAVLIGLMTFYQMTQAAVTVSTWAYTTAMGFKAAAEMASAGASFMATVAQHGLNKAIWAFPGTWIVAAIIAVVIALTYLVIAMGKSVSGATTTAGGIAAAFAWMAAAIWNTFASIVNMYVFFVNAGIRMANGVIDAINGLVAGAATGMSNFANVFVEAFNWIMRKADEFVNGILQKMQGLGPLFSAIGINLPSSTGGAFQLSKVSLSAQKIGHIGMINGGKNELLSQKDPHAEAEKAAKVWDKKQNDFLNGLKGAKDDFKDMLGFDPKDLGGAKNPEQGTGNSGGKGGDVGKNTGKTADNTGKMASSLEDTEEEMRYLRELAEQEHINQFTTAEIKVEMNNNNTLEKDADIDDVIRKLTEKIEEKMNRVAEGVYS